MKIYTGAKFILLIATLLIVATCGKQNLKQDADAGTKVPAGIIEKLQALGFDTSEGLMKWKDGYLVEYDILLTEKQIDALLAANGSGPERVAGTNARVEHYRSNIILRGAPGRTLLVYMDPGFGQFMQNAFDAALARYNNEPLWLRFQRTTDINAADIRVTAFNQNSRVLGVSPSYPTQSGTLNTPGHDILLNTFYYNDATARADAITTIAHEIGHAIGFRHTDYMNRVFSCGVEYDQNGNVINPNEGAGNDGAAWINNTPTTPVAGSWMLACSDNTDRPFTTEDQAALRELYSCLPTFPQITTIYMDGVPFQKGGAIRVGSHSMAVYASGNPTNTYSLLFGNLTITSTNGVTCNFSYRGGPAGINVNFVNACYNRTELINVNQMP